MYYRDEFVIFRWDFLKGFADNGLSRIIGILPLAGYLLIFNDQISEALNFAMLAGIQDGDPSPFWFNNVTKLRSTFFGSLFLLSALVICKIFCPKVLDNSTGQLEFTGRVRDFYTVIEISEMESQVMAESWRPRLREFWQVGDKVRQNKPVVSGFRPDVRQRMFIDHGDYISFLSREWWQGMMHTFRVARYCCLVFATIGYILLAVPTIDITQAVLIDLLGL